MNSVYFKMMSHCVCCVWDGLGGEHVALCCVCGTVWGGECAAGGFVLWVWDSWGSECAAGGFVLCVEDSWGSECEAGGFVLCVCVGLLGE